MTICVNCKFFVAKGKMWYDQFCGALPKPLNEVIDPVTGRRGSHLTHPPFSYARDINKGNCHLYEEKQ